MVYYISFLVIFGVLDIITLYNEKDKKGLIIYIIFAIVSLLFGILFSINEYEDRIYPLILKLLNLKV